MNLLMSEDYEEENEGKKKRKKEIKSYGII